MNLDEMKAALASEATKKADQQEREIKRLRAELREKDKRLEKYKDILRVMFNRCSVTFMGGLCVFCEHRPICRLLRSAGGRNDGK